MLNAPAPTIAYMADAPGKRLKALIEARGMNQRDVVRQSGGRIKADYLNKIIKGDQPWATVGHSYVHGIAAGLDLKVDDLIAMVSGRSEVTAKTESEITGRKVPIYDLVGAGSGLDGGTVVGYVSIPTEWVGGHVGYLIEGDSMAPTIPAGSTIIVQEKQNVKPGEIIVAFLPEHGMVVKRFHHVNGAGTIVLTSDNPNVPPIYTEEMTPIGCVVEYRAKPL